MSNFFDDYLKLNPVEDKPDKAKEKEKPKEDEAKEEEGGDIDDEWDSKSYINSRFSDSNVYSDVKTELETVGNYTEQYHRNK